MSALGYFPGCSLHATGREYDESLRAVAAALELGLEEVQDWACCGATSAHATNHLLSIALPARTLALAEAQHLDRVLVPCAACYSRLATARHELGHDAKLLGQVQEVLGRPLANSTAVLSIAELLRDLVPRIRERVKRPLAELKVACYYGCLLVRPPEVTGFDDAEAPTSLEQIVEATGAKPVRWRARVECCGGGFSVSRTGSVLRLGRAIVEDAAQAGAGLIVVACPMCHVNLDFRQRAMAARLGAAHREMPVLFITQLVGLALGLESKQLGLHRHFASTQSVLGRLAAAALPAGESPKALPAPPPEER